MATNNWQNHVDTETSLPKPQNSRVTKCLYLLSINSLLKYAPPPNSPIKHKGHATALVNIFSAVRDSCVILPPLASRIWNTDEKEHCMALLWRTAWADEAADLIIVGANDILTCQSVWLYCWFYSIMPRRRRRGHRINFDCYLAKLALPALCALTQKKSELRTICVGKVARCAHRANNHSPLE